MHCCCCGNVGPCCGSIAVCAPLVTLHCPCCTAARAPLSLRCCCQCIAVTALFCRRRCCCCGYCKRSCWLRTFRQQNHLGLSPLSDSASAVAAADAAAAIPAADAGGGAWQTPFQEQHLSGHGPCLSVLLQLPADGPLAYNAQDGGLAFLVKAGNNSWLGNAATYSDFFYPTGGLECGVDDKAIAAAAAEGGELDDLNIGPDLRLDLERCDHCCSIV